ncbi:MAG: polysaccharide deacetylase family protein [Clostridiales bacterium]|nr:polysaccharide deacetylase family protein [Clostridiales bacterium]
MKKALLALSLCLCLAFLPACSVFNVDTDDASSTEESMSSLNTTAEPAIDTSAATSQPTQITTQETGTAPVTTTTRPTTTLPPKEYPTWQNKEAVTGANTGTGATFTGFEPLPPINFEVYDPENTRGLDTTSKGYGFGLGKNGAPPELSLNNQKYFNRFNALAIDTKTKAKVLYLTFDCGYENGYTGKILDTLKAKQVPAAFFCTLPYIKQQTNLTTRMIKEGHIVGNHSDTHPVFPKISRAEMAGEVQRYDNYLRSNYGYTAPYFRFPEGAYSESALDLVQSMGFKSVFWSVAYADWDTNNQKGAQYTFDTVTGRLHPGAVILLHAVSSDNTAALGDIIDWARAQGYEFRPL